MTSSNLPGDPSLVSSSEELAELIQLGVDNNKLPVEHFFKLASKTQYKISPDGKYYSFMAPYERRNNIHVVEIATQTQTRLTSFSDRGVSGYSWANAQTIVFLKDSGGNENFHLFAANVSGEEPLNLTPYDGVRAEVIDILENDDEHLIVALNLNNPAYFEPYRINLSTGSKFQLAHNDDDKNPITAWFTDHEGNIKIAQRVVGGVETMLLYRSNVEDDFQPVITTNFKSELRPLFMDFEGADVLIASSNLSRDKSALVRYDLKNKKELEVLFSHDEVDVGGASYSKIEKNITAVHYTTSKAHRHFFDLEVEEAFKFLTSSLGPLEVSITSTSKDENRWIIRTYSDKDLGAYYIFDRTSFSLDLIAAVRPELEVKKLCDQRVISYVSRDGLKINGYLTLPQGEGPFPMIVNPHGGPWHRDNWGFNPEVQMFAHNGYAVLQMNFRGSTGYGRAFWEASFKQWGQKMQDDITDGVKWAIENGHAQAGKIAIYGGSYGGYATLAGVCYTPDLYKCAIDYVGVSNLFTFMKTIPPYWEPYLKMMYEMVGHPEEDKEMMEAFSPALQADKIKAPLFVIQGANDPRVHIDESDQIVQSLKNRGIQVPYMVKYDEGHGFHNEENRFEVYKAMLGFLKKYLIEK